MRFIIDILLTAGLLYFLAAILPGVRIKSFGTAVVVALVYGVLNTLLYSALALVAFIPMVLTLGLFGLVINAFLLWLTDKLVDDFNIRSFGVTLVMAVLLTIGRIVLRVVL